MGTRRGADQSLRFGGLRRACRRRAAQAFGAHGRRGVAGRGAHDRVARERRSCADDGAGGVRICGPLRPLVVRKGSRAVNVQVVTFGCRLNTYESEVIRRAGDVADTVVVNTCAVTAEAVRQARQRIRRIRREQPQLRIVVTGCAAQAMPELFATMPEVDRVLGNEEKFDPKAWTGTSRVAVADIMAATTMRAHAVDAIEGRSRAFVQVQNGCDHRCTFCIIPYGRGNSRSLGAASVVAQ